MHSPKYNRTPHLPWSPGKGSDDKVSSQVNTLINIPIVITEKLDGSNCSLERDCCFARTHSGPPSHPSFDLVKVLHSSIKWKIPNNFQLFGENVYAKHSIFYDKLTSYFYLFNVRELNAQEEIGERLIKEYDMWLSWSDVEIWAEDIGVPTVPILFKGKVSSKKELQDLTLEFLNKPSTYGDTCEGIVVRDAGQFEDLEFANCVMKCVRKDHVQTSEHWSHQEIVKNIKLT